MHPGAGGLRVHGRASLRNEKGQFATTVRLYAGLRRIDIRTKIVNQEQFTRYRALFPTSIRDGRSVHEIPFGAVERPAGIEFPAQNWIDCGNGRRGVALLNRGLPGNVVSGGTMMLSLLRSTRIVAYGFGGGYEPGMSSDSGLELGKELSFDYALVPHAGDWREAAIFREGLEFNHPLLAYTVASHAGIAAQSLGLPGDRSAEPGFLDAQVRAGRRRRVADLRGRRKADRRQDTALGRRCSRRKRSISWRTPAASWPWPAIPCTLIFTLSRSRP